MDDPLRKAIEDCQTSQAMIDINAVHLDGLRTQCELDAELTQTEIRNLESKLIKLFASQLIARRKCDSNENLKPYPQLRQWLRVVGLCDKSIEAICELFIHFDDLLGCDEHELKCLLNKTGAKQEEIRRLLTAINNLRLFTQSLIEGNVSNDFDLHWDSWDRNSNLSLSNEESPKFNRNLITDNDPSQPWSQGIDRRSTPPPTPSSSKKTRDRKFPTTPPPIKRHLTNSLQEPFPLTKSRSHEEHLAHRVEPSGQTQLLKLINNSQYNHHNSFDSLPHRRRLATEPGHTSPLTSSPSRSPPMTSPDTSDNCFIDEPFHLTIPRSPRTHGGMGHAIHHRFSSTITAKACQLCEKPVFLGLRCKECKYRCHRDCVGKVPPSCGLPDKYVDYFKETIKNEAKTQLSSSNVKEGPKSSAYKPIIAPPFGGPDSSSNTSSCNSSIPSSPALNSNTPPSASKYHSFNFPEISEYYRDGITLETKPFCNSDVVETQKSKDSDKTVSGNSGSTDSDKTLAGHIDSLDSTISDIVDRPWPRQNSLTMREWDIPYDDLKIEEVIGTGRFGTVFRGNWHGNVAIKRLNMNTLDDRKALEAFKQEVATFRKTRHENLVLFMGACMKPPHLAIVTSLCKGLTLYDHIHLRRDKFNLNRSIIIAQQISQGMGYLHARGIVHKDLKSKNIFYENGKVVITDFGLCSVTKLCTGNRKGNWLTIPKGWLCYLAPELVRALKASNDQDREDLPFSMATDVFAFGTVWYELLLGDWPFKGQPPEVIIWQVGRGLKQSLTHLQASKEIKDILMLCWAFKAADRNEFSRLLDILSRLPKKRLQRSPSHPIHLLRSAESTF